MKRRIAIVIAMFIATIIVAITVVTRDGSRGKSYDLDLKSPSPEWHHTEESFESNDLKGSSFDQLNPTFDEEVGDELYSLGRGAYYDRDNARVVLDSSAKKGDRCSEKELEDCERLITEIDPKADSFYPILLARAYAAYTLEDGENYASVVYITYGNILGDEAYAERIFVEMVSNITSFRVTSVSDYSGENCMLN